jgi:hypothetical protein
MRSFIIILFYLILGSMMTTLVYLIYDKLKSKNIGIVTVIYFHHNNHCKSRTYYIPNGLAPCFVDILQWTGLINHTVEISIAKKGKIR